MPRLRPAPRFSLPPITAGAAFVLALVLTYQLHQWPTPSAEAQLASLVQLEPAAGGAEGAKPPSAPEPGKGFTGKDLHGPTPIPELAIGGAPVVNKTTLKQTEIDSLTPPSLKPLAVKGVLDNPLSIRTFAHSPRQGNPAAPVVVLEFANLADPSSTARMQAVGAVLAAHASTTLLVHVFMPAAVAADTATSLPMFYGKVAAAQGRFFEYRAAVLQLTSPTGADYLNALMASGADKTTTRRLLHTEARRFFRELDADARLARSLNFRTPPYYVVNGLVLGDKGLEPGLLGDIITYLERRHAYETEGLLPAPLSPTAPTSEVAAPHG